MRAYQWLQHFDQHTKPRLLHRTDYRLLFFDGHTPHKIFDFINFCQNNRIIPYCFPSKLTHRLQPLDGLPFLQYKHYYRVHNNQTKRWGGSVTEKTDFLRHIHQVRMQTFKESTIRHSFKRCGLWPCNGEVICEELHPDLGPDLVVYDRDREYDLSVWGNCSAELGGSPPAGRPEHPPASSSTINSPPTTLKKLRKNISKTKKNLTDNTTPDLAKLKHRLELIFEGSLTQAELAAQATTDLSRFLANQEQANIPKTKRQVSKVGVLTVRDSNALIRSRDIAEAEKQRRQVARDAKKKLDEMMHQDQIREQKNQGREREFSWVTGDDGQPLYCMDRGGMVL